MFAPETVRSILLTLVNQVDVKEERVEITLYGQRLHDLVHSQAIEKCFTALVPTNHLSAAGAR